MTSFAEFESTFLDALPNERSYLQGLQGKLEAQLSAWIEHIFRDYLGYSWQEILHPEGTTVGSKGSKQLYRDLQINILDNGFIFFECKRTGRLSGSNGQLELDDAIRQLRNYIRAQVDPLAVKPNIALGLVTDGNRWHLMGLRNDFYTIADWTFLTDDPRLIARHLWLLAKPALAQPTSAFVEFLARRTLADFLQSETKWITKKVNENLPDGAVSEELIGKWLRDAFSDPTGAQRLVPSDSTTLPNPVSPQPTANGAEVEGDESKSEGPRRSRVDAGVTLPDLIAVGILSPPLQLFRKYKGKRLEAILLADGAVEFQGKRYDTCSGAAEAARATVTGQRMNTNGWTFWQYQGSDGKTVTLHDARLQDLFASNQPGPIAHSATTGTSGQKGPKDQPQRHDLRKRFWQALLARPKMKGTRHADIAPGVFSWIGAGSGVRGLPYVYAIGKDEGRVELYIDRGAGKAAENKELFDRLHQRKAEIERDFGGPLSWQRLDDKQGCRIACEVTGGGWKSDESKWPAIQDALIDAMVRLEKALAPHLARLKTELTSDGA